MLLVRTGFVASTRRRLAFVDGELAADRPAAGTTTSVSPRGRPRRQRRSVLRDRPGLAEALAGAEHTPEMAVRADRSDAEARAVRAARPRAVILPLVPGRSGAAPGSPPRPWRALAAGHR